MGFSSAAPKKKIEVAALPMVKQDAIKKEVDFDIDLFKDIKEFAVLGKFREAEILDDSLRLLVSTKNIDTYLSRCEVIIEMLQYISEVAPREASIFKERFLQRVAAGLPAVVEEERIQVLMLKTTKGRLNRLLKIIKRLESANITSDIIDQAVKKALNTIKNDRNYENSQNPKNKALGNEWSESLSLIRKCGAGTPEKYKAAIEGLDAFIKYYNAIEEDCWKYEIPAIDTILDMAPKIFDEQVVMKMLEKIKPLKLEKYNYMVINTSHDLREMSLLKEFYFGLSATEKVRQVDLAKQLKHSLSRDVDANWYFYIWRQFDMVSVEKKGRYNYITRNEQA